MCVCVGGTVCVVVIIWSKFYQLACTLCFVLLCHCCKWVYLLPMIRACKHTQSRAQRRQQRSCELGYETRSSTHWTSRLQISIFLSRFAQNFVSELIVWVMSWSIRWRVRRCSSARVCVQTKRICKWQYCGRQEYRQASRLLSLYSFRACISEVLNSTLTETE